MATVPTFDTWSVGEKVTAAKMTSNVRSFGDFWRNPPRCKLNYDSTAQTTTNNTAFTVTWQTESYDTDGMHASGAQTIVIVTPGVYRVRARVGFGANATGYRQVGIYKNGSVQAFVRHAATPTLGCHVQVDTDLPLIAGDILRVDVVQTSGGNLALSGNAASDSEFSALWVAA